MLERIAPIVAVAALFACTRHDTQGASLGPTAAPSASATPEPLASAIPSAAPADSAVVVPAGAAACGALGCLAFTDAQAALEHVLRGAPRVVAFGETHAQKGSENLRSTTRRFMDSLLPALKGRASDLVIELWLATGKCGKAEKKVAKQTKAVTATQAQTNQNEFLELGTAAKQLGIVPHALEPSCDEYQKISGAGAGDVAAMLEMIAQRTESDLRKLLARPATRGTGMLLAYGGALHNDLQPRAGRETWSFGPAISKATGDRYVEIDLIVREFVRDTEAWRAQPWYAAFERDKLPERALLYTLSPGAYVLVFPKEQPDAG